MMSGVIESFPPEIVVEILSCCKSFNQLYHLISSSPVFLGWFNVYPTTILTQTAKNVLGDAWEDAFTVLVHQRHQSRCVDIASIRKDLQSKIILTRADVLQLNINQQFYNSCFNNFKVHKEECKRDNTNLDPDYYPFKRLCSQILSFKRVRPKDFTLKRFYEMRVLSLRFKHESITTFTLLEPRRTIKEYSDLYYTSRVMDMNRYSSILSEDGEVCDLFDIWKTPDDDETHNPPLFMKLAHHFRVASSIGPYDDFWYNLSDMDDDFNVGVIDTEGVILMKKFAKDYMKCSVDDLIEKYELDKNGLRYIQRTREWIRLDSTGNNCSKSA